jgi:hypothetical protein
MADVNEKVVVVDNKKAEDQVLQLDYSIKHPLHNTWTLWFDNPGRKNSAQNWAQNLKEVFSFNNVEDFWRYPKRHYDAIICDMKFVLTHF